MPDTNDIQKGREAFFARVRELGGDIRFIGGQSSLPRIDKDLAILVDRAQSVAEGLCHRVTVCAGLPPPVEVIGLLCVLRRADRNAVVQQSTTDRRGQVLLAPLEAIEYRLQVAPGPSFPITANPFRLKANKGNSFIGSCVLGMGFVLTSEEAQRLIDKDPKNKDVLFPYLNGEDLNSRPDQSPSRWVINFFDWPLERAREYADCFHIIEEKVKPERARNNRKVYRDYWWQYAEKRPALYRTIAGMKRVLVTAEVSKHINFVFRPVSEVFSNMLIVFPLADDAAFGLLQSMIHEVWVRQKGSTLETRPRYAPSDRFDTFPFPRMDTELSLFPRMDTELSVASDVYCRHRDQVMRTRSEGLTKTYNRFHDRGEASEDIVRLRHLHVAMDQAVAAAYGWEDLDLGHGYHDTRQGLRYTVSEPARQDVVGRLLTLNHQRHDEEVRQGPPERKKGAKNRKKGRSQ